MKKCPYCQGTTRQNRAGKTKAGSQRYRYMHCGPKYTSDPKAQGYPESMRKRAMEMYVDGNNLRRIARHLQVSPQTVAYRVTDVAETLPNVPLPDEVKEAEMDEMFTFLGDKKTKFTLSLW
jgi:transposase-like protein